MPIMRLIVFTITILISLSSISYAQSVLYGAAGESCDAPNINASLYIVDPQTAETSLIGPIGFNGVTGMAVLGDGRIVASANSDLPQQKIAVLIEINPFTGQGALIGQIGDETNPGECGRVPDLTYDPATDTLYGAGKQCNDGGGNVDETRLLEINPNTAQATIIGNTGEDLAGTGLAMSPGGTLFLAGNSGNSLPIVNGQLFTINPANAQITSNTPLIPMTFASPNGMDFDPDTGVLFSSDSNAPNTFGWGLETVDTQTGVLTLIGPLPDCFDALVFFQPKPRPIPTLSQWGIIAAAAFLGLAALVVIRRRRFEIS